MPACRTGPLKPEKSSVVSVTLAAGPKNAKPGTVQICHSIVGSQFIVTGVDAKAFRSMLENVDAKSRTNSPERLPTGTLT